MASKKVLIADDNENIRDALTYLLEDEGFDLSGPIFLFGGRFRF